MKLNIASGYEPMPLAEGWVNLDVNPRAPDVDIVGPMYPLDLPDQSVDEIRATNCAEHVPYRQTQAMFDDWARVLVHGGSIFVQVPDAEMIARWMLDDPAKLIDRMPDSLPQHPTVGAAWRLLGGQLDDEHAKAGDDPDWNLHRALFTPDYLNACMERAGFTEIVIETNPHPNLLCHAVKP